MINDNNSNNLPSTSSDTQSINRRFKLSSRHVSPIKEDDDTEMDEYAPIRLTFLVTVLFVGILIYLLIKLWRRRAKTRIPIKQTKDTKSEWSTALLESEDEEELIFSQNN